MPRGLSKALIEQIRAANDIVEVIGSYVPLKRAGSTFKALCPFHREKTPSFVVNPQHQFYHCFGCQAGGDVFRFIMAREGMDFITAVRHLARRAGIRVEWAETKGPTGTDKDRLFKLLEDVALFYHATLREAPAAEPARRYLAARDLDEAIVRDYLLGFAPEGWDTLSEWARQKKYPPALLDAAGLRCQSETEPDRAWDRFRNRLMFPIRDEIGRVVGFSGRLLGDQEKAAKYVNTPETAVFHKGRVLYALDRARRAITESRTALLCEGQIDVIRCHRGGFANAVAAQGTALTEQHAQILKRYADSVTIVLDADAAGQQASLRTAEILLGAGLSVRIASLPPNEDPDSLIRGQGPQAFHAVLEQAVSLLDFQIAWLRKREDCSSEAGLLRAARAVLETIARAPTAIQRDHLLRQAARALDLEEGALRQDLTRISRGRGTPSEPEVPSDAPPAHPPEELAILELAIHHPEVRALFLRHLPGEALTDAVCRLLFEQSLQQPDNLIAALDPEQTEAVRLAAQIEATHSRVAGGEASAEEAAQDLILLLRRKQMERQREELRRRRQNAPEAERAQLDVECAHLTRDIKLLQQGWAHALPVLELD